MSLRARSAHLAALLRSQRALTSTGASCVTSTTCCARFNLSRETTTPAPPRRSTAFPRPALVGDRRPAGPCIARPSKAWSTALGPASCPVSVVRCCTARSVKTIRCPIPQRAVADLRQAQSIARVTRLPRARAGAPRKASAISGALLKEQTFRPAYRAAPWSQLRAVWTRRGPAQGALAELRHVQGCPSSVGQGREP